MAHVGEPPGAGVRDHRGRGPRNYEPSDGRLKERIAECLAEDPRIDASDVELQVEDRVVTLAGSVEDWWAKLAVEDLTRQCGGVREIHNRLRIRPRYLD